MGCGRGWAVQALPTSAVFTGFWARRLQATFPARWGAVSWIDGSGNLWLFGGYGGAVSGLFSYLNDLWRYDIASGQWTWMSGANTTEQSGNYGVQGTPAASNVPGARRESVSWVDGSGNLWLFGGIGFAAPGGAARLNDLWRYDPTTGQWTWMSGANTTNQAGAYGVQGTAAAGNVPGALCQCLLDRR